ncbi:hypothetical protein [Kitasatospora sp. NPDC088134]|uniref:hypothetical protein n=1 Tax=Kitasatospora sp. NPDC088134 TaxID=3364071 RepID=UPI0038005808
MKPRRYALAVVAVLLCAPLTAGCSFGGDGGGAITAEQAKPRIEALLSGTVGAVQPPVQYLDELYDVREHTDWKHDSDGKSLVLKKRHLMPMISQPKRTVLLQQLKDYWKAQGYTLHEDNNGNGVQGVSATAPDGTKVGVSFLGGGSATITAGIDPVVTPPLDHPLRDTSTSPRPPGTPEPGTQDDPYWSH